MLYQTQILQHSKETNLNSLISLRKPQNKIFIPPLEECGTLITSGTLIKDSRVARKLKKYSKIMFTALKLWMPGHQNSNFKHLSYPKACSESGKHVGMFFQRANTQTKIPKIHVYSFKSLGSRASGLHFSTPSWAWGLLWGCYPKFNPTTSLPIY